jgi:hypothetical protein
MSFLNIYRTFKRSLRIPKHRHLGPGYFVFFSILSIKCASTTYLNPFDMLRCEINAFIRGGSRISS